MSGKADSSSATHAAAATVAAVLAIAAVCTAAALFFGGGETVHVHVPPSDGGPHGKESAPLLRRQESWIYFRGKDIERELDRLADFDIVVVPGADAAAVKRLRARGCTVVAEEPRFGGLLDDGRGEKTVGKIDGAVCWIGADFGDPGNKILAQENMKTMESLKRRAQAHPGEKVLVFAKGVRREHWELFRTLMRGMGFVPCAGPDDASSIFDFVHETAAAVPRAPREG